MTRPFPRNLINFPICGNLSIRATILEEIAGVTCGAMKSLLDRQREDYPFIDTKLHPLNGKNFPADDPLRGSHTIYSWIQGRGLGGWHFSFECGPTTLKCCAAMTATLFGTRNDAGHSW